MVRSSWYIAAVTAVQSVDPHHRRRPEVSTVSRGFDHGSTNSDYGAPGTSAPTTDRRFPMTYASSHYRLFVGVDVAATTCAVAWMHATTTPSRAITIDQTAAGFAALQRKLQAIEPEPQAVLIVMEATGTYWMRLASSLVAAGFAVAVVNPAQAHDFAKALLKRSKTDAIDAQTLAEFAARLQPQPWTPPPPVQNELQQRLVHRDALVDARNQLHAHERQPVIIERVQTRLHELIATLSAQIAAV